jgi:hypothetical protein
MFRLGQRKDSSKIYWEVTRLSLVSPSMVVFYAFFPEQKRLQKDLHKPTPMDFPGIKH